MPDTPDAGILHPEALKVARKRQNMTQQRLAETIGCTKDTVSRWERGTSRRVRSHLREPLREALGVRNWEILTKPPKQAAGTAEDKDVPGHAWIKFLAEKNIRTGLQLVALRYGIHPWDVLKIAPLLFLIVAERSLLERRKQLDELETKVEDASRTLPRHLFGHVTARNGNGEDPGDEEIASIEAKDIFGRRLSAPPFEDEWEEANPFINFIRDFAQDLPEHAVAHIEPPWEGGDTTVDSYQIADDTLRDCTGISEEDERGEELLRFVRLGGIDLAECLRIRRDRDDAGYRQWLSEALTHAKEEAKRALKDI